MKTKRIYLSLLAAVFFIATAMSSEASRFEPRADLGTMTSFYRYQPCLTEWFYKTPENIRMTIPSVLSDKKISFPYKKKASDREILFCDNVNIVRFLGGWTATRGTTVEEISKVDLAYRDNNGKIQYRWNLLKARLDPVIKMGYTTPTIVLDNIPWCFPKQASEPDNQRTASNKQPKGYGQNQPPHDMNEWTAFIEELCRQMVKLYGFEMVNGWTFRLGTEMGGRVRWDATQEEYAEFYVQTAKSVLKVLPGANFGPYNRAGADWIDLAKLADRAKKEKLPYGWIATSFYSIGRPSKGSKVDFTPMDPDKAIAKQIVPTFDGVSAASERGGQLPKEIHEYGWFLVNEYGNNDNAPGARGAAGNFYNIFGLRQAGLTRLYHWILKDPVFEQETPMLHSQAWLFSIWDYTLGSHNVELNYQLAQLAASTQKYKSIGFFREKGTNYIMTACYNMDRNELKTNTISVFVPREYLPKKKYKVSATWLSNSTDPYMQLRNDFEKEGLLAKDLLDKPNVVLPVVAMTGGGRKGTDYVRKNYEVYAKMMKDNLTLKKYPGSMQITPEGVTFTFEIESPMVMLIAIE